MAHKLSSMVMSAALAAGCASTPEPGAVPEPVAPPEPPAAQASLSQKEKVVSLLSSLESGDPKPVAYINPTKYIQHNLDVADGLEGFGAVLQHKPPEGFKANVVRAFEDGEFVFTLTEYEFFGPKIGFDVFRFENGLIV